MLQLPRRYPLLSATPAPRPANRLLPRPVARPARVRQPCSASSAVSAATSTTPCACSANRRPPGHWLGLLASASHASASQRYPLQPPRRPALRSANRRPPGHWLGLARVRQPRLSFSTASAATPDALRPSRQSAAASTLRERHLARRPVAVRFLPAQRKRAKPVIIGGSRCGLQPRQATGSASPSSASAEASSSSGMLGQSSAGCSVPEISACGVGAKKSYSAPSSIQEMPRCHQSAHRAFLPRLSIVVVLRQDISASSSLAGDSSANAAHQSGAVSAPAPVISATLHQARRATPLFRHPGPLRRRAPLRPADPCAASAAATSASAAFGRLVFDHVVWLGRCRSVVSRTSDR